MKKPYKISFPSSILTDHHVKYLPQHCLYPIPFAHAKQIVFLQGILLNQYLNTYLTYADLYEIQVEEAFTASVEMLQQQHFLFFMLEGSFNSTYNDGQDIFALRDEEYCATYKRKGNYHVHFKAGTHRFLVIAYRPDWSKQIAVDYPHLNEFFKSFHENKAPYHVLPTCKINRPISLLLYRLSKQRTLKTKGELGAVMKRFISKTLTHYNDQIFIESGKVSLRAKIHIHSHYHDSELTIELLIDRLFTTGQTLRENFKKEYGKSPNAYLIEVRMQKAHYLLKNRNLPIHTVCRLVGYDDAKNFSLQYKKFFGYPPSKTKEY